MVKCGNIFNRKRMYIPVQNFRMSSVENMGARIIYIRYCPSLRFYIRYSAVLIPFTKDADENRDDGVRN